LSARLERFDVTAPVIFAAAAGLLTCGPLGVAGEGVIMDPLIDPGEYAALAYCTYLNQASLGLIPRTSLEASVRFLADVAQHGNLRLSDQAEARVLDGLRTAAAELLGAPAASVAVVGGASEGLGQLAALLSSAGGEVVLVSTDFPSVTYPWLAARDRLGMGIRWVRDTPVRDLTLSLGDAISERTTVVCVSPVQFATGSQVDVAALVARARDVGARVVADVTQMAGAAPVTMTQWGVDALVCSGYKWLSAPSGVALLAMTEDLAAATPVIVGWKGSATPFDFTPQELSLAADARRFELSTMSYSAAVGLLTSIKLLTGIGLTAISEHARRLAADLAEQTAPLGWAPYRAPGERSASGHIVSLRHPAAAADEVQAALASQHDISTSSRAGGIRVSLHAYNSSDDIRALAHALASVTPRSAASALRLALPASAARRRYASVSWPGSQPGNSAEEIFGAASRTVRSCWWTVSMTWVACRASGRWAIRRRSLFFAAGGRLWPGRCW
jgi:cysteine desulfurase / selenocysteine lyase